MESRPDPDSETLKTASLFLRQFERRHLSDDGATRQLLESISAFLRIAARTLSAPGADTTKISDAVEEFAPHVFSLLEGDWMTLEPYERLEDDRFNLVFPHLILLVQFLAFNALAIRTGAGSRPSCVGELFAGFVRQLTEERTDANGTTYSTFL